MVLAVVDDLLFQSKIRAVAAGAPARSRVRAAARCRRWRRCASISPDLVILDLDRDALDPDRVDPRDSDDAGVRRHAARRLRDRTSTPSGCRRRATAGCDRVMARSGFVAALPDLLRRRARRPGADAWRAAVPTIADLEAAADPHRAARVAHAARAVAVAVRRSRARDVWLKLETMQTTGSFKIRGATNAMARLREARPAWTRSRRRRRAIMAWRWRRPARRSA